MNTYMYEYICARIYMYIYFFSSCLGRRQVAAGFVPLSGSIVAQVACAEGMCLLFPCSSLSLALEMLQPKVLLVMPLLLPRLAPRLCCCRHCCHWRWRIDSAQRKPSCGCVAMPGWPVQRNHDCLNVTLPLLLLLLRPRLQLLHLLWPVHLHDAPHQCSTACAI